jgi:hypothetical protein
MFAERNPSKIPVCRSSQVLFVSRAFHSVSVCLTKLGYQRQTNWAINAKQTGLSTPANAKPTGLSTPTKLGYQRHQHQISWAKTPTKLGYHRHQRQTNWAINASQPSELSIPSFFCQPLSALLAVHPLLPWALLAVSPAAYCFWLFLPSSPLLLCNSSRLLPADFFFFDFFPFLRSETFAFCWKGLPFFFFLEGYHCSPSTTQLL